MQAEVAVVAIHKLRLQVAMPSTGVPPLGYLRVSTRAFTLARCSYEPERADKL